MMPIKYSINARHKDVESKNIKKYANIKHIEATVAI